MGRVLGEVWDLLGVSWSTFKRLFSRLCCQEGPRGGQEASWVRFNMVWEVLGRVWEAKMDKKIEIFGIFLICFSRFNFGRILFDF